MKVNKIAVCFFGLFLFFIQTGNTQETFPVNDVQNERSHAYAFTNATIVVNENRVLENATMLIKDGLIVSTAENGQIPDGYVRIDLNGKYLYPSFIDLHTHYGMPEVKRPGGTPWSSAEKIQSTKEGAYNANEAIKAEFQGADHFKINEKAATEFQKIGFGTVLAFRPDGIARGTGAVVTLATNNTTENKVLLKPNASAHFSFDKGSSNQTYPVARLGQIALLRQTWLDADWYQQLKHKPFTDHSLIALNEQRQLPQFFEVSDWKDVLRADKIGDEFGIQYIIKTGNNDYQRAKEVKATGAKLIVPLNFPEGQDVEDPIDAEAVTYEDMLHWELAPQNAALLEKESIEFALTSDGLSKKMTFHSNLQKAIQNGLSEKTALKALTSIPAKLVGMQQQLGSLEKGKIANFLITDGKIFDKKTKILENWIQGVPYRFGAISDADFAGKYTLTIGEDTYQMEITGQPGKQSANIVVNDTTKIKTTSKFSKELISLSFVEPETKKGKIRLSGWTKNNDTWSGQAQLADGSWTNWTANRVGTVEEEDTKKKDSKDKEETPTAGTIPYPFKAYGLTSLPEEKSYLLQNATVWTNEAAGVLENTDVLIKNGKIAQIGRSLSVSGVEVIDATGKHLTAGIIDEHTHIATSAVNDYATNCSMVRIGDVLDSEDADIYRALAGGVTAAQVLHGSANPIGGQSGIIKMRWGASPEELKIRGADGFIKFALGENVKRSSNRNSIRYPQTRMGVEQVYMDAFSAALEYQDKWNNYQKLSVSEQRNTPAPRRDLAMEAILEIINKKRFISCHSYVQSEINMLMKVAEHFGFNINTFTHILEGYKVADKMAAHGVAGSTFSDWWNYKWEVRYAIPYNAAIMHREGVLTAINSDDNNIGRRLNQEAAKTIKYGDISPEDALKMVTLNPAKMLHLDDRMGSIKVGKDGDVVLWTDNPLSVYARAEKTFVDGKLYFDIQEDKQRRIALQKERARLIQKLVNAKKSGQPMKKGSSSQKMEFHCNSLHNVESNHEH